MVIVLCYYDNSRKLLVVVIDEGFKIWNMFELNIYVITFE